MQKYLLFGCDRRGRCPRGVWRTPPPERSPAFAPAAAGPAPGSRPAEDLRPRPRHRNAPKSTQLQHYNTIKHHSKQLQTGQRQIQRTQPINALQTLKALLQRMLKYSLLFQSRRNAPELQIMSVVQENNIQLIYIGI